MSGPGTGSAPASSARLFDAAVDKYESGDTAGALEMAREILRQHPEHLGSLFMMGRLALEAGRPEEAFAPLTTAVRLQPQNGELLYHLGMACFRLGRWTEAIAAYRSAAVAGRSDAASLNDLGLALKENGEVDSAIETYHAALKLSPDDPDLHNNLGTALNRAHDHPGAIAAYRRALELQPKNADVWANLATIYEHANMQAETEAAVAEGLRVAPQHENLHLIAARCSRRRGDIRAAAERLQRRLAGDPAVSPGIRRVMEYELGRCHDLLGDPEAAYVHLATANRMTAELWPELKTGAQVYLDDLGRLLRCFTPGWTETWPASPAEDRPSPVFLLSFPRSGTTLMDTMLDAHPKVVVLEEEPPLEEIVGRVQALAGGYPGAIPALTETQIREMRAAYWKAVDAIIGEDGRGKLLIDKKPLHSTHAGFIRLLFPRARFIFALRHPCDVVFSCFMQAFGRNAAMENFRDLNTAAETYRRVMDLWQRYRELFDLDVHEIRYESLVTDKQAELGRLLAYLGLDWEQSMDDHTRHARKRGRIYTPSYHQVIQPLYTDAIGRWQAYARHFGPALDILKPYIMKFGYSAGDG